MITSIQNEIKQDLNEILVFDLECNGFKPSEIFMIGIFCLRTRIYTLYLKDEIYVALMRLEAASLVIGHNIRGFDLPVIERLTEGLVVIPKEQVLDTLDLSRLLFPELKTHKLKDWGEIFGFPKLEWTKFDKFYFEMIEYMERDVMLNVMIYEFFVETMENIEAEAASASVSLMEATST